MPLLVFKFGKLANDVHEFQANEKSVPALVSRLGKLVMLAHPYQA